MKKHLLLASALFLGLVFNLQAQTTQVTAPQAKAPQAIQYQTIIRNAAGEVVMNQAVGLQLTIRQTTADGTAKYQETHTATTNAFGLVNLQIGTGMPVSGTFSAIDWSMGPYYLEVGLDLTGGSSYTVMGTTQLLSVPYALYAETAGNPGPAGAPGADGAQGPAGAAGNTILNGTDNPPGDSEGEDGDFYINTATNEIFGPKTSGTWPTPGTSLVGPAGASGTHYVGELFGGGIVFWVDGTGEHGLIASLDDLDGGSGAAWSSSSVDIVSDNGAEDFYDGAANTAAIVAQLGSGTYAAKLCADFSVGSFDDWYLPSHSELELLGDNRVAINKVLANDSDSSTNGLTISNANPFGRYWSSTEVSSGVAWSLQLHFGNVSGGSKSDTFRVRAVRAF